MQCQAGVSPLIKGVEWKQSTLTFGHGISMYTLWSYPPHRKPSWIYKGQTEELLVISSLPHKSMVNLQFYFIWDRVPGSKVMNAIKEMFPVLKHPEEKKKGAEESFVDYVFSISIFLTYPPLSSLPAALVWLSKAEFAGFKPSQSKQTKNLGNDLS